MSKKRNQILYVGIDECPSHKTTFPIYIVGVDSLDSKDVKITNPRRIEQKRRNRYQERTQNPLIEQRIPLIGRDFSYVLLTSEERGDYGYGFLWDAMVCTLIRHYMGVSNNGFNSAEDIGHLEVHIDGGPKNLRENDKYVADAIENGALNILYHSKKGKSISPDIPLVH